MNQFRSVTLSISMLIFVVGLVAGQSRSRTKLKPAPRASATPVTPAPTKRATRMVTINFKQGEAVTGAFLQADAEAVQIEAQSGRLTIKLNEIDSLVFAANEAVGSKPAAPTPQQNPPAPAAADPTLPAARKAYQGLRKLADAVQLGLPYPQFGNLLIEVKPAVEDALASMPETALKGELKEALAAYVDGGQAWAAMQALGVLPIATEPGATLMKKYEIKPSVNAFGQADHLRLDVTLSAIWAVAAKHLDNAAQMLKAS